MQSTRETVTTLVETEQIYNLPHMRRTRDECLMTDLREVVINSGNRMTNSIIASSPCK